MYLPEAFAVTDPLLLGEVIRNFPFATLVTRSEGLFATHLPIVFDPASPPHGKLRAHVARANPQWRRLQTGAEVLVIFQGPHAYISPRWYVTHPAVPTWNYVAVHAYGRPKLVSDPEQLLRMVEVLTARFEPFSDPAGEIEPASAFRERMLSGLVGFEIEITRLEGKFKLSQNRPAADVAGVIGALAESSEPTDWATAQWMRRFSAT